MHLTMNKRKSYTGIIMWIIGFLISLFMFLSYGCKTKPPLKTEYSIKENKYDADSISRIEKLTMRLLTIPASSVALNVNMLDLSSLPIGAKYEQKQGQATVTVEKTDENNYKITANCDSLSMVITERETQIYHLQAKIRELEESQAQTIEIPIYKQTDLQIVFGWFGKVFMGLIGIGLILLLLKWKRLF